ncbi:hypothetical protein [[Bacillus] enclensis]|uniref:hypothetical protein n=1 Tax=[Bacillus] enclensis TaxID=1402860 RepID=UPI0018DC449D|nr:hypothetical protein [[Bacillus] enclensis]MBH9968251.1 hypothetical protein [[Bacillus] enclensis]
MNRIKLAIITSAAESDLAGILLNSDTDTAILKPSDLRRVQLDQFDSFAILGGTQDLPLLLDPRDRNPLEAQIKKGKKVFAEYTASIGNVYFSQPESTRYERLVYTSADIQDLRTGTVLDDQCGMRIKPHDISCTKNTPVLEFCKIDTHDFIEVSESTASIISDRALWFDDPENLLICSFRLSNFQKARYASWHDIKKVIGFITGWLIETPVSLQDYQPTYETQLSTQQPPIEHQIMKTAQQAMSWFNNASIVIENGKGGAIEGLGTEINPDGTQRISTTLRADCIGEISLSYLVDYLHTGNQESLQISDNLTDFIFENYLCQSGDHLSGMMRWTDEAWGVCYQDDVARAIIPQLLKCLYLNNDDHLAQCINALKFLTSTTGTDGTRVFRTDNLDLTPEKIKELKGRPGNLPSAHYNAYYHAALLLAYKLTNIEEFKTTAVTGLTTIMNVYPDTTREQSETQEYCRLILPLSWLYWVTKEEEHKTWLYKVRDGLMEKMHPGGGFLEWDTGYKASMRHAMGEGESSLLTKNGDPVIDLLYSNNWLPMAFIQAWWITGDEAFQELWQASSWFFANAQIRSDNLQINGAWARAYDIERKEVFGSPADSGWGPWAIESGWTVAEVTSGLYMGLLEERLASFHKGG